MPPRILISFDFDPKYGCFLREDYWKAFRKHKASVETIFYDDPELEGRLDNVQGVVIPGGLSDLHPELYGEQAHPETKANERRANHDLRLIEAVLKRDLPLLAICYGFQSLNVFLGGSLFQHLPEHMPGINHREGSHACHDLVFEKDGEARKIFGVDKICVNSTHHQGINRLGKNLAIEGRSPDGLIECVRVTTQKFAWGVQWHPERLADDPFIPAFLKAAQR